jgi:hypothetical protein
MLVRLASFASLTKKKTVRGSEPARRKLCILASFRTCLGGSYFTLNFSTIYTCFVAELFFFTGNGVIDFGPPVCVCVLYENVPVIHIFRLSAAGETNLRVFFLFQKGASYTHFCNLIFSKKTKQKKTINFGMPK